jgi:predicted amino acid dehydrogenase
MPVTTGNSLTVALAVSALEKVVEVKARLTPEVGGSGRRLTMGTSTAAVVGASGSVGLGCAEMLAPLVDRLILVGHREIRLSRARAHAEAAGASGRVRVSTRVEDIREADLVLTATSTARPVIESHHLKENAIVCDVALPPDVSPAVRHEREDVSLIDGGIVDVPGHVDFGFDFGLPPGQAYACMAEAMVLAMEGKYESFSLGRRVSTEKAREIARLATKHGFRLAAQPAFGSPMDLV